MLHRKSNNNSAKSKESTVGDGLVDAVLRDVKREEGVNATADVASSAPDSNKHYDTSNGNDL
jgi:hypothetical protein